MHELTIEEAAQVSGGLTYYYTYKGVVVIIGDEVMPSPGPVVPEVA